MEEEANNRIQPWRERIRSSFLRALESKADDDFLEPLQELLYQERNTAPVILWQGIFFYLSKVLVPQFREEGYPQWEMDDLIGKGSLLTIAFASSGKLQNESITASLLGASILKILITNLAAPTEMDSIYEILREYLPILGVKQASIALKEEGIEEGAYLLKFAIQGKKEIKLPREGVRFQGKQLWPRNSLPDRDNSLLLVYPLFSQGKYLGFMVMATEEVGSYNANLLTVTIGNAIGRVQV